MKNISIRLLSSIFLLIIMASFTWQENWGTYLFRSASFKMKFPKLPTAIDKDNLLLAKTEENGMNFQVAAHYKRNFDIKKASSLLEESINGFTQKDSDKIVDRKKNMLVAGFPAEEVRIRGNDGMYIVFRTLITKDTMFQFVITSSKGFPNESISKAFLDSFTLVP